MAVEDIGGRLAEIDLPDRYRDRRRLASSRVAHLAEHPRSWARKQADRRAPIDRKNQINGSSIAKATN
jgi:hypothetical protein